MFFLVLSLPIVLWVLVDAAILVGLVRYQFGYEISNWRVAAHAVGGCLVFGLSRWASLEIEERLNHQQLHSVLTAIFFVSICFATLVAFQKLNYFQGIGVSLMRGLVLIPLHYWAYVLLTKVVL